MKALKEYVEANPNATALQIEKFVQNQTPEFAKKYQSGEEILKVIKNKNTNLLDNTLDFLRIGIQHILSGLDHILFVLAILLVFVSLRFTLKLTATFTLAHSITIILAGLGLLTLSSRIVEPFIALSIAYVAIMTVFFKKNTFIGGTKSKIGAIFFFGLFHRGGSCHAGDAQESQNPYTSKKGRRQRRALLDLTRHPFRGGKRRILILQFPDLMGQDPGQLRFVLQISQ